MRYEILCRPQSCPSEKPQKFCVVDFGKIYDTESSNDLIKCMVEAMEGIGDCSFEFRELKNQVGVIL